MAVRKDKHGAWRYRVIVKTLDGKKVRISGTPSRNTREAALEDERAHIDRARDPAAARRKEMPTFEKWFNGRFMTEWVIARKNKPSEVESKKSIYKGHLGPFFGTTRLDDIDDGKVAAFKAKLVQKQLSDKTINNVLAVLSKPLRYAHDVKMIDRPPRIGILNAERPEIVCWSFDEYARLVAASKLEGARWHAAVLLAGEAGLRVGEVKALRWTEDVDLIAGTITVNQQRRKGVTGTPKGRTRRTVPMTARLHAALKAIPTVREGLIVLHPDGTVPHDNQVQIVLYRICRRAGLPQRQWHTLRHTFGTHAALFGVNPWSLMTWMGHKRVDETMLYVHVAEAHRRTIPPELLQAAAGEADPDRRIIKLLSGRGNHMAKTAVGENATDRSATGD